ncbi:hypothetical protein C9J01_04120 [Photobacterium rosenbergii]|uniref:Uncharacterized protein n=1 Tax=Photobacterium rosenbergii TaxID=294936 RepID=A0A2T3NKZ7_9GAMM|nr:hypothetical protein C9J01_04120 [Photobacterium rosenbergii]
MLSALVIVIFIFSREGKRWYVDEYNRELRDFGCISDSYGKRYLMFPLLLVLNDLKKAEEYIGWHDSQLLDESDQLLGSFKKNS